MYFILKDTATPEIYPLPLHDALPIYMTLPAGPLEADFWIDDDRKIIKMLVPGQSVEVYQEGFERKAPPPKPERSEEHTSELQSPCNLVCRLLLEKKINHQR